MKTMNKAFTLVELVVVCFVVSLLTGIIFVDYGKNSKAFALERVAQRLAQDLRRTQEMSMVGLTGDADTNAYGVYFDKTGGNNDKYIIYRNNNANKPYDSVSPADTIKETITLEHGIKIFDIQDNSSSIDNVSISFVPPDPINYIESNPSGHEAGIIVYVEDDPTQKREVKINSTGRIDVVTP